MHDKNWIPQIGKINPSNCKADTKDKGDQELKKIQLTRDLKITL